MMNIKLFIIYSLECYVSAACHAYVFVVMYLCDSGRQLQLSYLSVWLTAFCRYHCRVGACFMHVLAALGDVCVCAQNAESHRYHSRDDFLEDVELIYTNCLSYNGPDSSITATARRLMETCKDGLIEVDLLI